MKETKREQFVRIAEQRPQKVLDDLKALSKCCHPDVYEHNEKDLKKIFEAMQKKRLMDLLTDYSIDTSPDVEYVTEHLLTNGVIAPACKIGDTVYMITSGGGIRNLTVTHIDIKLRKNETAIIYNAVFDLDGHPCEIQIVPSKIGETYFFNIEATKKALEVKKAAHGPVAEQE